MGIRISSRIRVDETYSYSAALSDSGSRDVIGVGGRYAAGSWNDAGGCGVDGASWDAADGDAKPLGDYRDSLLAGVLCQLPDCSLLGRPDVCVAFYGVWI